MQAGHKKARVLYPVIEACEECDVVAAVDRHHVDGDTHNNARENVQFLCRRCHMAADGRLAALRAFGVASAKDPAPCQNCGRETRERKYGRCGACYRYLNRRGKERPVHLLLPSGRVPQDPIPAKPCVECGREKKPLRRGLCGACNERKRRREARAAA